MVTPTLRGVGVTKASGPIQIDRYTDKSDKYVAVEFLNPDTPFDGWKAILWNTTQEREPRWISYARVDFGKTPAKVATMRVISKAGGTVELRADAKDGPVLATFNVPGNGVWTEQSITTEGTVEGIHDLYLLMTNGSHLEVDWVSFK